ncbi:MAG: hypothetical protein GF313_14225 [Caldithrix sp.]|nr:hypothetical protein [Caldithrix sp.]
MKGWIHIIIIVVLGLPTVLTAQLKTYDVTGYVKYMYSSADIAFSPERMNDHLLHSRLNMRWFPTSNLTGAMEVRFRGLYGQSIEQVPDYKSFITSDYPILDMEATVWDENRTLGLVEIDRLHFDYLYNDWQITAGRQRIAWGTALVWNVIDVFNPKSILNFDYEENPGADALRVQYYTGPITKVEVAYQPGDNRYEHTVGLLWNLNYRTYDIFLLGGWFNNRKIGGLAWAGDIYGAGFRGEVMIGDPLSKGKKTDYAIPPFLHFENLTEDDRPVVSYVLSGDYTFSNSFYIHSEVLFNNVGKRKKAGLFQLQATEAGLRSPARWSLYQEFAYDLHPLIRGTVYTIYNPDDQSYILVPNLTWSVITNVDLLALTFIPAGERLSEFGSYGNSYFLRLKFSF